MAKHSAHILALEVSERHIAALRAHTGAAGVTVTEVISETGHWPAADGSLQRKLIEVAEKHGFVQDRVVYVFPRHLASVRTMELPTQDEAEVKSMVELSAEEWVPFNPDEVVTASCISSRSGTEHSNVLAAVVPESTIEEHIQILRGAEIEAEHIYLSTGCLFAALEYPTPHSESALYFHQSGNLLEVIALRDGSIEFTRAVEAQDDSDAAIVTAIHENLALYERSMRSTPTAFHFSETVAQSTTLSAQCDMDLQPAQHGLRGVRKGIEHLDSVPLPLLGAILLTQGDASSAVELLPENITRQRRMDSVRQTAITYAAMAAVTLILLLGVFGQAVYQRTAYLNELEARASVIRPEAERILHKRQQLQRMQSQVTRDDTPLENLARIAAQTPESDLNLTRFNYRFDQGITIQGRAKNPSDFSGMIDRLRTVGRSVYPQLATVQEVYRRQREEQRQPVWDFSISIDFPSAEGVQNE